MTQEIQFESEYILHTITQKHLKELFDLEFVASEIQLNNHRLDNLAFDRKTKSFVIIEYKNQFDSNVLNQIHEYHDLVNKNKEFFCERLDKETDVDFENTREMIISPEFSQNQIDETESYIELWKTTLYNDCRITYENMKTSSLKTLKIDSDDLKLTEEMLLNDKSEEIIKLYNDFKNGLIMEFDDLDMVFLVDAVSIKSHGKYLCIVNVKNSMKIHYYTEKFDDIRNWTRDISDITTGGPKANYELTLSQENIDYAIDLIRQVYNEKVIR